MVTLADRALVPVIPAESEFPYTLRLVSEVLSSTGSTSMASFCGSTLALMDTGVPIKAPVAGIAMGLIKEGDQYTVLTDILGAEDHLGDMDFKVAGTAEGITALQMDMKIKGITPQLMSRALEQARVARLSILGNILDTIAESRPDLKPHVPRITMIRIPVDKIGAVIGPGGKMIRSIQEETGVKIDINDDGAEYIAAADAAAAMEAQERVEALTLIREIFPGATHQVCVFHVVKELNLSVLRALAGFRKSLPKPPPRQRGRPKKGEKSPGEDPAVRLKREVWENRHLWVKHHLTPAERRRLARIVRGRPLLRGLRELVDLVYALFVRRCRTATAIQKLERLRRHRLFKAFPQLEVIRRKLMSPNLEKALLFLDDSMLEPTSNAVERENRRHRKRQKTIYRARTRRSIYAFRSVVRARPGPGIGVSCRRAKKHARLHHTPIPG